MKIAIPKSPAIVKTATITMITTLPMAASSMISGEDVEDPGGNEYNQQVILCNVIMQLERSSENN